LNPYILLLALHWRKILAIIAIASVLSYLRSCFAA
jgi:hypothetical protein